LNYGAVVQRYGKCETWNSVVVITNEYKLQRKYILHFTTHTVILRDMCR